MIDDTFLEQLTLRPVASYNGTIFYASNGPQNNTGEGTMPKYRAFGPVHFSRGLYAIQTLLNVRVMPSSGTRSAPISPHKPLRLDEMDLYDEMEPNYLESLQEKGHLLILFEPKKRECMPADEQERLWRRH